MGCKHPTTKVLDFETGLPVQKPKCSKKTLKAQNRAKAKMNKAMAEVKAKGDAELAAALAGFGGIQLPAATSNQTPVEQTPIPEQTTPMEILKALMKDEKSLTGFYDTDTSVTITTDAITVTKMIINDAMSKTEDLKEQSQSAPATERPTSSASGCSRLIVVAEADTSVDNTKEDKLPTPSSASPKIEALIKDSILTTTDDTIMSVKDDAECQVKDDKAAEGLTKITPATERPTSSASVHSRLIVVAEAKTSVDNTMEDTTTIPTLTAAVKTEEKPLNQQEETSSILEQEAAYLVDAVFASLDNDEETPVEPIVNLESSSASIKAADMTIIAAGGRPSSQQLGPEATNLVDAIFASLDEEQLALVPDDESQDQSHQASAGPADVPVNAQDEESNSLDLEAGNLVDAVLASIANEPLSPTPVVKYAGTNINESDMLHNLSEETPSTLDQEAANLVNAVFASITSQEQLSPVPSKPEMQPAASAIKAADMHPTTLEGESNNLDLEASNLVNTVLASITAEERLPHQLTASMAVDMPPDKPKEVTPISLDQQAADLVDAVLASISTEEHLSPPSKVQSTASTIQTTDISISTGSIDKAEITRIIMAQLKKSTNSVMRPTSQMATQTCEISIQTDNVIQSDKTSGLPAKSSAVSKIKAVIKSASKKSRTSLLGRKDKKSNENVNKNLKNNKQASSQSKGKSVDTKKSAKSVKKSTIGDRKTSSNTDPKKSSNTAPKKSSNADLKKSSNADPKKSSSHDRKTSSSTDHKKSSIELKGSTASSRMLKEAANGAGKKNVNAKTSKKATPNTSATSATSSIRIKEHPAEQLKTSKSASFPRKGSQQKPNTSASAPRTNKRNESSHSANTLPTDKHSKQSNRIATPMPAVESSDKWSAMKSKSSRKLKHSRVSFQAPQDVSSSPSVNTGRKVSVVESKDSNMALISANSPSSPKPSPKLHKRSGRNGSKGKVSITSEGSLRKVSSAHLAQGPKRFGLATVPEMRPNSVMDNHTDSAPDTGPLQIPGGQAMGDHIEALRDSEGQHEGQSLTGHQQDSATLGTYENGNKQQHLGLTQKTQDMDVSDENHSIVQPSKELPSIQGKLEEGTATITKSKAVQPNGHLCDDLQHSTTFEFGDAGQSFEVASNSATRSQNDKADGGNTTATLLVTSPPSNKDRLVGVPAEPDGNTNPVLSVKIIGDLTTGDPSDDLFDPDTGQSIQVLRSPGGTISKSPHCGRALESPQGKTTPILSSMLPASTKPSSSDLLAEPDTGQSIQVSRSPGGRVSKIPHGASASESPEGKKTPTLGQMMPSSTKPSSDLLTEPDTGQSIQVSRSPGGRISTSPHGKSASESPGGKKTPTMGQMLPASTKPPSDTLNSMDHLIRDFPSCCPDNGQGTKDGISTLSTLSRTPVLAGRRLLNRSWLSCSLAALSSKIR